MAQNELSKETSPYLLQHAQNPVHWQPWGDKALEQAKQEDKLIIVSIGYSTCHWCHVMERESFEDHEVAAVMNAHFVCIKVDREELPDVDQTYMKAVQIMSGQGGWPLNCILLPDGRPVYGGTYFRKEQWIGLLNKVHELFVSDRKRVEEYGDNLTQGILDAEKITVGGQESPWEQDTLIEMVVNWRKKFDRQEGGMSRAPKFPMPDNYRFLLKFSIMEEDTAVLDQVQLTLNKIGDGGIHDHIGGGFYRYSTDMLWKVPHFEKMLYDNAQLISLYADAYRHFGDPNYLRLAKRVYAFMDRELHDHKGGWYTGLDADSDGEEGLFYTWEREELYDFLKEDDANFIAELLHFDQHGWWEGRYIPLIREHRPVQAELERADAIMEKMRLHRENRVRPALDHKVITSWNGLMITALCDLWKATGDSYYIEEAERTADFFLEHMVVKGTLMHIWDGKDARVNGYLEDYALLSAGLTDLFLTTGKVKWIEHAQAFVQFALEHFHSDESPFLLFTSDQVKTPVARQSETEDNVIPSSNAVMAKTLHTLGLILGRTNWMDRANSMASRIAEQATQYGPAYSHWAQLGLLYSYPTKEIVFAGKNAQEELLKYAATGLHPEAILSVISEPTEISLHHNRFSEDETVIYECQGTECKVPVHSVEELM
mgnify:CR=1 FL=1